MQRRILIVDDQSTQRASLALSLRMAGFEVQEADEGEAALHLLQESPAELALVDLMLPGESGVQVVQRIRLLHPQVQVVLTSAYHLTERQVRVLGIDAIAFVPKPYALEELTVFLEHTLVSTPPKAIEGA